MTIKLFPALTTVRVEYLAVEHCPLCGSDGVPQVRLSREAYRLGLIRIPLPPEGVRLMTCLQCDLLWKTRVPTAESISAVMELAPDQWKPKPGHHPRLPAIRDILRHENPEKYALGQFESDFRWPGTPYSTVTAFDLLGRFANAAKATRNILQFVRPDGLLIVETGNWRSVVDLDDWYYTNLFEHQIFWSKYSLRYFANRSGLRIESCERVTPRDRLGVSAFKRLALKTLQSLGPIADPVFGIDARLIPPSWEDHLLVAMRKPVVEAVAAA